MRIDLHTHSNASDGILCPQTLWRQALQAELDYFAITDHDTLAGFEQLQARLEAAQQTHTEQPATQLISGVEISCLFGESLIHIVGLDFDASNKSLNNLLNQIQTLRAARAHKIAEKLGFLEVDNLLQQVQAFNQCELWQLARPHFARFLVDAGRVDGEQKAFKQWLGQGRRAYVQTPWPELHTVVRCIVEAGGIAVLAHPMKYKMSRIKLRALLNAFVEAGGRAVELVYLNQKPNDTKYLQQLAASHGLYASLGSDFHDPQMRWTAVGKVAALPDDVPLICDLFKKAS